MKDENPCNFRIDFRELIVLLKELGFLLKLLFETTLILILMGQAVRSFLVPEHLMLLPYQAAAPGAYGTETRYGFCFY